MANPSRHILGFYDAALSAMQNDLLTMAGHCERNLRNSLSGLLNRDDDLCNLTIADDEEIDQLQKQVDRNGIDVLRRFQPVAGDLRYVVAAMKLSGHLERVADQAVKIARKARKLNRVPILPELNLIDPMDRELSSMLADSLRAYIDGDLDLAIGIPPRDKILDGLNHDITEALTARMAKSPERMTDYLELIFIARHVERAGDHVKNIAEDIVYAVAAEDIRHMGPLRPRTAADLRGEFPAAPVSASADEPLGS
jgi:phosphate transport system protein